MKKFIDSAALVKQGDKMELVGSICLFSKISSQFMSNIPNRKCFCDNNNWTTTALVFGYGVFSHVFQFDSSLASLIELNYNS